MTSRAQKWGPAIGWTLTLLPIGCAITRWSRTRERENEPVMYSSLLEVFVVMHRSEPRLTTTQGAVRSGSATEGGNR